MLLALQGYTAEPAHSRATYCLPKEGDQTPSDQPLISQITILLVALAKVRLDAHFRSFKTGGNFEYTPAVKVETQNCLSNQTDELNSTGSPASG